MPTPLPLPTLHMLRRWLKLEQGGLMTLLVEETIVITMAGAIKPPETAIVGILTKELQPADVI